MFPFPTAVKSIFLYKFKFRHLIFQNCDVFEAAKLFLFMEHRVMYLLTEWGITVLLVPVSKMCVSACLCINPHISKKSVDKPDNCGLK